MTEIAPTAVVHQSARLADDCYIGPGCVVEAGAILGDRCHLTANVYIASGVVMGRNNHLHPNCVMGQGPQIVGVENADTQLVIGNDNIFRENVTISRGSPDGSGKTIIGNNNFFMIGSHIGHDCEIEDRCVLGNYAQIGGHSKLERNAWINAMCGTQPFLTVGRYAFLAAYTTPYFDIPPFLRAAGGYPARIRGVNIIGLQRGGFAEESIRALEKAFRRLYPRRRGTLAQAVAELASQDGLDENVTYLLEFLKRSAQHPMGRYRELSRKLNA